MSSHERRRRILFICGSLNQTSQMHAIARELPDCVHRFTPYYGNGLVELLSRLGLAETTIVGKKLRARCLDYLGRHALPVDCNGRSSNYDLVVTCSDVLIPDNVRRVPIVAVQEGILDPEGLAFHLVSRFRVLPRWLAGTAMTGLSRAYARFCVASEGYREHFVARGAPADRVVVTGIPNFDDCARYRNNTFPLRKYVLVCTSDARETFKIDRRTRFLEKVARIADGRPVVFKLHPNERPGRATREIRRLFPHSAVYVDGIAEEMIANCDVLVTQYSSTGFVGLALGKEVHSYFDGGTLRRLLPVQNGRAAQDIADVCREVMADADGRARSEGSGVMRASGVSAARIAAHAGGRV